MPTTTTITTSFFFLSTATNTHAGPVDMFSASKQGLLTAKEKNQKIS